MTAVTADATALMALWEAAAADAPLARADRFAAQAGAANPAVLALDLRDAAILRLQALRFGDAMAARLDCALCCASLDVTLSAAELAAPSAALAAGLRAPTGEDMADALAASRASGIEAGRRLLAARVSGNTPETLDPDAVDAIEAAMEVGGAPGDIELLFTCPDCGASARAGFDPAAWLWCTLNAHVTELFAEVAALARAFGWSEPQVLALSPARRRHYLALAGSLQ